MNKNMETSYSVIESQQKHIEELESLVEAAYREGYNDGRPADLRLAPDADFCWKHSDAKAKLEQGYE